MEIRDNKSKTYFWSVSINKITTFVLMLKKELTVGTCQIIYVKNLYCDISFTPIGNWQNVNQIKYSYINYNLQTNNEIQLSQHIEASKRIYFGT